MSRVADQRAERLQALDDSSLREGQKAAEYETIADIVEANRTGEVAQEVIERLRKDAAFHRDWGAKWRQDAETLRAQYERTEPSEIGTKPDAIAIRNYLKTCSR